jgi:hypothetical protein
MRSSGFLLQCPKLALSVSAPVYGDHARNRGYCGRWFWGDQSVKLGGFLTCRRRAAHKFVKRCVLECPQ